MRVFALSTTMTATDEGGARGCRAGIHQRIMGDTLQKGVKTMTKQTILRINVVRDVTSGFSLVFCRENSACRQ